MKVLIILVLLFCSIIAKPATYYVSSSDGNDDDTGLTEALAWASLTKVSTFTFAVGDQILFKRGDTWQGTLTISTSGNSESPIVYGAYGTGDNPIITGFAPVTAWTNLGNNIWESTNAVSTLDSCRLVTINGVNTPMGRTPNLGSYYTFQSHTNDQAITSSDLTGTPDWTGAEVVIRKRRWIWESALITSQSTGTINYTNNYSGGGFTPVDGWGFFIQKDVRTLDVQNEWYYNPTTKKIRIYSTSQPVNVKVASSEYAIKSSSKSYITLENLNIAGANTSVVYIYSGSYFTIQNCTINYGGLDGIYSHYGSYKTFNNNIVKNSNYAAIRGISNTYETITNNTIDSSAMVIGIGRLYAPGAIYTGGENVLIQYNTIDHSGYNGIFPTMATGQVRNNFINNSLLNRGDGGGIYTAGAHTNLILDGNIVDNTVGYGGAMKASYITEGLLAHGIYLDMPSTNVTVSNNTVVNSKEHGIFTNQRSFNNSFTNNTCYNNGESQFSMVDMTSEVGVTYNNSVNSNIFVSKASTQFVMKLQSLINNIPSWFSTMNNNVYARPIDDIYTIAAIQPSEYGAPAYKTLAQWQTFSGKDANSTISPFAITSEDELLMIYNPTASDSLVTLPFKCKDLNGASSYTVNLLPYTSKILFRDFSVSNLSRPVTKNSKYMISRSGKIIMTQ